MRLFDPEWVGYLLKANLTDREITDFQHLSAWRRLVLAVPGRDQPADRPEPRRRTTVLDAGYWSELVAGCNRFGHHVFHVVLDAAPATLRDRIGADEVEVQASQWRIDHLTVYETSRAWMTDCSDVVVDTTARTPAEVAEVILEHLPPVLAMPARQKSPIHR